MENLNKPISYKRNLGLKFSDMKKKIRLIFDRIMSVGIKMG